MIVCKFEEKQSEFDDNASGTLGGGLHGGEKSCTKRPYFSILFLASVFGMR